MVQFFKSELLLSDTSLRTCPSIISYTKTHRLIGDQASLVVKTNMKSSFNNINKLIALILTILFVSFFVGSFNSSNNKLFSVFSFLLVLINLSSVSLGILLNSNGFKFSSSFSFSSSSSFSSTFSFLSSPYVQVGL